MPGVGKFWDFVEASVSSPIMPCARQHLDQAVDDYCFVCENKMFSCNHSQIEHVDRTWLMQYLRERERLRG